jgi:hypothetical protein
MAPRKVKARPRGRPRKGGEKQVFALRLPVELHRGLRHLGFDERKSINDLIVEVLEKWWAKHPRRAVYEGLQALVEKPAKK